jgi:hypothetical protein
MPLLTLGLTLTHISSTLPSIKRRTSIKPPIIIIIIIIIKNYFEVHIGCLFFTCHAKNAKIRDKTSKNMNVYPQE